MANPDERTRPATENPERVDFANASAPPSPDEDDDVYENFPGLNPARW